MKIKRRLIAVCIFAVYLFTPAVVYVANDNNRVHIMILATTDLHGNINPIDYNADRADNRGLARVATVVKRLRKDLPDLLLLDCGDTIQGTPLTFYHATFNNRPRDPMMTAMNEIGYDAMTVGNHEYEFGFNVLNKARSEARFPWLSANTYKRGTDETFYTPYLIKQVQGVRIAVLGLTTTGMANFEDPAYYYSQIDVRDTVSEARKWVDVLRRRERADVVVIAMHMGLERDLRTDEMLPGQMAGENTALLIAEQVAGIDLILMGHTHREVPSLSVNGVLMTQADRWGRSIARADLFVEKAGERWRVVAKEAQTISVGGEVEADPEVVRLVAPYDRETQRWLSRVIGRAAAELRPGDERFRDTALLDLVHRVQLDASGADVSMAASLNPRARILKGPVTVRDIMALYEYEETLIGLQISGRQLKDALEHSARHFGVYKPGRPLTEQIDERFPSYNYDVAEGVSYELDISKPWGERIRNLRFRGRVLLPQQKLRLVTNKYRANGAAGYTMFKNAPVYYRSSKELRELIIDWVKRHPRLPEKPTNNWRLVPNLSSN